MRARVSSAQLLQLVCVSVITQACVSLAHPGRYTPPEPRAAPQASSLSASLSWRESDPEVGEALERSFRAHLSASKLFAKLESERSADVHLHGFANRLCEPYTVFRSRMKCASLPSFGYSGMNVLVGLITLGIWPAVSILGVPTDWGQGQAQLTILAKDPISGVTLKRWTSGLAQKTAYAGLYYSGSPLNKSLAAAATALISRMRPELSALEERLKRIQRWRDEMSVSQGLESSEAAIRVRALLAAEKGAIPGIVPLAADEHELVREGVVRAMMALGAEGPSARGALQMLAKDPRPKVQYAARDALRALDLKGIARSAQHPEVSRLIL